MLKMTNEYGKKKSGPAWAANALAKPAGVGFAKIAYSHEMATPRHCVNHIFLRPIGFDGWHSKCRTDRVIFR